MRESNHDIQGMAADADRTSEVDLMDLFLASLRSLRYMALAARDCGVTLARVRRWCEEYPEFADQVDMHQQLLAEGISSEIYRRGVEGIEEDVYYQGIVVGSRRVFSDALLLAEARRRDPAYRSTAVVESTGEVKIYQSVDTERL
jgi:hypothetical protein